MSIFGVRTNRSPMKEHEPQSKNTYREGVLQKQIEEVREKAVSLQGQLDEKEQRVSELENAAAQREEKEKKLDEVLNGSREAADQLIVGVTVQIQEMIEALDKQMSGLDVKTERQIKQIGEASATQIDELQNTLKNLEKKLDLLKIDINDKIHSEDVKCYRNIKGLFMELEEKLSEIELGQESMKKIRKSFGVWKFFSFFAFLDFILILFYILYSMGVFNGIF